MLWLGSTRLSYLHQSLFNFNKLTWEQLLQPTAHISGFLGAKFLDICAILLDKQSRGHESKANLTCLSKLPFAQFLHPSVQLLNTNPMVDFSFETNQKWRHWGFYNISWINFICLFQNTGIHCWTRISKTAVIDHWSQLDRNCLPAGLSLQWSHLTSMSKDFSWACSHIWMWAIEEERQESLDIGHLQGIQCIRLLSPSFPATTNLQNTSEHMLHTHTSPKIGSPS